MNHRRRTVLPCPDCCAPRQSLDRKSTRNSHTLLRAGNEVLWERQRQRVEVYFCTVTTTLHVEYFRDLYKTEYDWGDLDCLRENRPYPPGTWQDSWALYHSKNSHLQTYIHQAMAPCTVSYLSGRHVFSRKTEEIWLRGLKRLWPYLSTIWSRIWSSSRPIHHPYCDRWQNRWPGSQRRWQNTVSPLKGRQTRSYQKQLVTLLFNVLLFRFLKKAVIGWVVIAAGRVLLWQRQRW